MVVTWSHYARLTSRTVGKQLSFWHRCSSSDLPAAALLSLRYINSKSVRLELWQNISQDRPNQHSHCQPQAENIFSEGNISEFPLTGGAGSGSSDQILSVFLVRTCQISPSINDIYLLTSSEYIRKGAFFMFTFNKLYISVSEFSCFTRRLRY